jgi:hypothetical protein
MVPFRGNHLIVHLPRVRSIKPLIRPVSLPCLLALLLRSPSQGRLLIVYTRPSDLWLVYMSLPEDDNRPVEAERRDPEHLGRTNVSLFSSFLSLLDWLELINLAMCRVSLSMISTIQTSIPRRRYLKMNLRIQKSGPLSPTQMIQRWHHLLYVHGSSVSLGLSLFLVSINSFTSDILPLRFPRFIFSRR